MRPIFLSCYFYLFKFPMVSRVLHHVTAAILSKGNHVTAAVPGTILVMETSLDPAAIFAEVKTGRSHPQTHEVLPLA